MSLEKLHIVVVCLGRHRSVAVDMDFLTLVWGFAACTLLAILGGAWLAVGFWLRCDLLQEQKVALLRQLEVARQDRAEMISSIMELEAALRAERFHVEQLQRKITLLKLVNNGEE
ncbi:hypothetical protein QA447_11115 [Pseudomonas sp. abacavir_1]